MARGRPVLDGELDLEEESFTGGQYFDPPSSVDFFSSGCALLDCVLGNGWPEGKLVNIVGDSGSGKSLLCIEACANFAKKYPGAPITYVETEAAFDPEYASRLGIPLDAINLEQDIYTVEDLFRKLEEGQVRSTKTEIPELFIVDSLDALSDETEIERGIGDSSYGANKAKKLTELFRRLHAKLSRSKITVFIVSQTRDNIGVSFGNKLTRSGGKALRFYASIEMWLAYTGKIEKTIEGVKRTIGVTIKVQTKKNRMAPPHRDCTFDLLFNFGVDSFKTNIDWLTSVKRLDLLGLESDAEAKKLLKSVWSMEEEEYSKTVAKVDEAVHTAWRELEEKFSPTKSKY